MLSVPVTRSQMRNDVKAAEQGVLAQNAANEINKEKTMPDLSLFSVASLNSRKDTENDSMSGTLNNDHPYYQVGIKFAMPLNTSLVSAVHKGYDSEINGGKLQFKQKKYKQDKEWVTLVNKLKDTKERLEAADELEKAQLTKLENERERQQSGQSTMFQVFVFEQEYLASQLNLINIRGTALGLLAQVKIFNEYYGGNGGLK
jgi:outer membrane protein TolC